MNDLGVTLLYRFGSSPITGVMKSYALDGNSPFDIERKIELKVTEELLRHPEYKYLGVNDLYKISNVSLENEMLGRVSYYELTTEEDAKGLVKYKKDFLVDGNELIKAEYVSGTLAYFYKEDAPDEDDFALTVMTIVKLDDLSKATTRLYLLGDQDLFKLKIAECSDDIENVENLGFLGIHELHPIKEEFSYGEAYQTLYSKFDSEVGLEEEKISESEWVELLNELTSEG